jgi:hypothetical protein
MKPIPTLVDRSLSINIDILGFWSKRLPTPTLAFRKWEAIGTKEERVICVRFSLGIGVHWKAPYTPLTLSRALTESRPGMKRYDSVRFRMEDRIINLKHRIVSKGCIAGT